MREHLDPNHVSMLAALIHSGNPSFTVQDSAQTAVDLIRACDKLCEEDRALLNKERTEMQQQRQR